jgi:predicted transcriptional regulator
MMKTGSIDGAGSPVRSATMKAIYTDGRDPLAGTQAASRSVASVMSSPVAAVRGNQVLGDALRIMVGHGVRHLVVIDGLGRCVGVLADRTIASVWATDAMWLSTRSVAEVLEPVAPTVGTGAHVLQVARVMRKTGTDGVAVVDEAGVAVGIVTGSDLIALLAS